MYKRTVKILIIFFLLAQVMSSPLPARAEGGPIPFVGEIRLFAFDFAPSGGVWVPADGQTLQIGDYTLLFNLIGNIYGGNGVTTFAVPNLNGAGSANPWGTGKGRYFVAASGIYPSSDTYATEIEPYIGEIRLFLSPAAPIPQGWRVCNGDVMLISENTPLFTLLAAYYGGDGTTTFALPDLRGLEPVPGSRYCISVSGSYPLTDGKLDYALANVYTGEIRLVASTIGPDEGWLRCNGQSLSASSYPRLFSLLSTMYGGSGANFSLPNLNVGPTSANPWGGTAGGYCIVVDEEYAILPVRP